MSAAWAAISPGHLGLRSRSGISSGDLTALCTHRRRLHPPAELTQGPSSPHESAQSRQPATSTPRHLDTSVLRQRSRGWPRCRCSASSAGRRRRRSGSALPRRWCAVSCSGVRTDLGIDALRVCWPSSARLQLLTRAKARLLLLCCCAAVLLCCCAAVLLCCCAAVLLCCCAAVLLCCSAVSRVVCALVSSALAPAEQGSGKR